MIYVKSKENKIKIYTGLLITVICIIGISYAWFRLYLRQSENNKIASRNCFSTSLTEDSAKIDLVDAVSMYDEEGLEEKPFTFTIKNNCSGYVKAYITIDSQYRDSSSSSYLKDKFVKVNLSPKGTTNSPSKILTDKNLIDLDNNRKGYLIVDTGLNSNEERSFDLRIWIDSETTTSDGLNKTWLGKIVVVTQASNFVSPDGWNGAESGTLLAAIKRDNIVSEPLTTPGEEVSAYTFNDISYTGSSSVSATYQSYYVTYGTGWEANGTGFNLTGTTVTTETYANSYSNLVGKYLPYNSLSKAGSETSGTMMTTTSLNSVFYVVSASADSFVYKSISSNKNTTEKLLSSAEDDYGTSYYFRGTVENNFVEYANMCWQIVRVTGDGSIKLVLYNYNGLTDSNETPSSSNPCSDVLSAKRYARFDGDIYQTSFNKDAYANKSVGLMYGVSGASTYADTHANNNSSVILNNLNKWYTKVLSKQVGFNENQLADTIWCNDKSVYSGTGIANTETYYGAYGRLSSKKPSLKCPNDSDGGKLSKFTVNDIKYGNGNLEKKIGLLTIDETVFAGLAKNLYNGAFYLSGMYWVSSPASVSRHLQGNQPQIYYIYGDHLNSATPSVNNCLLPSISLVSNIKISSGDGTAANPYKVKM